MDKNLYIFAGVNGAGKTSLYKLIEDWSIYGVRINPDEVLQKNGGDWRNGYDQIASGRVCVALQKECFEKGVSFNRETTFASREIISTIDKAIALGYDVEINFVGVESVEIAKQRVLDRVKSGGHGIEASLIEKRFDKSKENLIYVAKMYPKVRISIYDNSESEMILAARISGEEIKSIEKVNWTENILNQVKLARSEISKTDVPYKEESRMTLNEAKKVIQEEKSKSSFISSQNKMKEKRKEER